MARRRGCPGHPSRCTPPRIASSGCACVYWVADMDIDCDGRTTAGKCDRQHDLYYLEDTNVHGPKGALSAAEDPYVVIPIDFACPKFADFPGLAPGTTVAVIFGNKIQYAV